MRQRVTLATGAVNANRPKRTRISPWPISAQARSGVTPKAMRRKTRDFAPMRMG